MKNPTKQNLDMIPTDDWKTKINKLLPNYKGCSGFSSYQEGLTDGWNGCLKEIKKKLANVE